MCAWTIPPRLLPSCPPTFPRLGSLLTFSIQGASRLQSGAYLFVMVSRLISFSRVVVPLSCLRVLAHPLSMVPPVPLWVEGAPPLLVLVSLRLWLFG